MRALTIDQVELMLRAALDAGDISESKRLSRQLDELDEPHGSASPLGAALWYAEHGLRVFPLLPRSKQPWPRSHGCHDATTDVDRVRQWWAAAPTSNVGIATGHLVDVIDIDGPDGNVSLARMFNDESDDVRDVDRIFAKMMSVVRGHVLTPRSGGRHLYVRAQTMGNGAKLGHGIDYRGSGGYVVAPPSVTDVGVYRWTAALDVAALS